MKWRITIQRLGAPVRNAMNEPAQGWADFGAFWADRLDQRPAEGWKAGQTAAQLETVWRVRWSTDTATITAQDRVRADGQDYRIIGVTEPLRREVIQIVAVATVA
jgi:SPP1 family predicted phage head-tail adaptor